MKNILGVRSLVLVSSSSMLLLGCEGSKATVSSDESAGEPEAQVKCEASDWRRPQDRKLLPERFEAEATPAHVSWRAIERNEKDPQASKKRVHSVRFKKAGGAYTYNFKPRSAADAEIWLRYRTGREQGIWEAWVDEDDGAKATVDAYGKTAEFGEVLIGFIAGRTSRHRTWHQIHVAIPSKNEHSSSYGATMDFIELRSLDPSPCAHKTDGTSCDDGDACTQGDTCQAGACISGEPVVCSAQDACHAAGVCDPSTGACTNPELPDGSECDDGDLCTQQDTCQAGACVSGSPVVCEAQDMCHAAGECDPTTGACSNPPLPDGTECDDDNLCTQLDTCQAGACAPGAPVTCPNDPSCAVQGECMPETGECSAPQQCSLCGNGQMDPGEECEDGNSYPDDGCSPTCMYEYCGDGIVQSTTIQSLTVYYLGRACNAASPALFSIKLNGVPVVQEALAETCDCEPGIRTVQVLDPALRAASVNGLNSFELSSQGELAWVMVVIYTSNMAMGVPLWDWMGNNDAGTQNPNLCTAGALSGFGMSSALPLSGGETCDDGNNVAGDGCTNCQLDP